jgi:hypothetical protein
VHPGASKIEAIETVAADGIWCLGLHDELVDASPFFALWDTDGGPRAWLPLPPTRMMIGIAHLWLRSVPSPPGTSRVDPAGDGDPPPRG